MWARTVDGQQLSFHLAGIHNQNFLMRDEQTGSFWQQVSGRCVAGPLAGAQLRRIHSDELSLAQLAAEAPGATVLLGDPAFAGRYEADWEQQVERLPSVVDTADTALPPRTLVAGVQVGGAARAYLPSTFAATPLLLDELGGAPVLLWSTGPRALRAFERRLDGAPLLLAPAGPDRAIDSDTGSVYDARGCAIAGPRAGRCLPPIAVLWDYWFDWHAYHPDTDVHGR